MSSELDREDGFHADATVWCEDGHSPKLLDENDECHECGKGYDVSLDVEVRR